ncbi:MAG: hypothetical protein E7G86_07735 [Prevotella bivia]|nr:hypothetical protein [Prevotella bivia]MDU3909534.1 hypothetical protein [Prevotella bivia]
MRTRNLSHKASSPSSSAGNSLLAAIRAFMGNLIVAEPFWYMRSLMTVSKAFCMAGPAFHISSRKITEASGR